MEIERINMIGEYMKREFGCRIVKLPLDGGFTCPNRDGSKGTGGCIFCSADGSGDFAGRDLVAQMELTQEKWPDARYLAYFQNHTNTYAPVSELRRKYESVFLAGRFADPDESPDIVGLAIATRPDCITDEAYELLAEINERTFLWVELGLQSIHEDTAETMNRCYDTSVYDETVDRLAKLGIRTVTHLILGLPSRIENGIAVRETRNEMLESIQHVCGRIAYNSTTESDRIFGIKLHMLNVVKGSSLAVLAPTYTPFESIDEYTDLVCDLIRYIPKEITVHRLSADAPRPILISPEWSYKKRTILNDIHSKMSERNIFQGMNVR